MPILNKYASHLTVPIPLHLLALLQMQALHPRNTVQLIQELQPCLELRYPIHLYLMVCGYAQTLALYRYGACG